MAYFTKQNAKIFYELYGDGEECITLINGYTRSSSDFKLIGSFLAEGGKKVLCFDNRGSGRTESAVDFLVDDIVRDVTDLWDELDIAQSHVLGISMGGFIAQTLAIKVPERIISLCLVSTSVNVDYFPLRLEWPKEHEGILNRLRAYFHPDFVQKNVLLIQAMAKQIAKENENGIFEEKAKAQRMAILKSPLKEAYVARIKLPCLIIHGREDSVTECKEAEKLHKLIEGSQLYIYEKAGHLLLLEQKNDFYNRVHQFFSLGYKR